MQENNTITRKGNPKFEIKNFNLWYKNAKTHALKNISFKIPYKKVTAFIGPSGCGKSTLLRSFNRMNDLIDGIKTEGDVQLDGKSVIGKKINIVELRTRVGMVFQKPNPFPMSIYNNVAFGPKSHGIKKKEELNKIVKESLIGAALWDEVKHNLNDSGLSLSGGQQQRLCIARAIAMKPEVLLMDEPTASLDPISTIKIEQLILQLKKQFTIVIVTHSMQQAARISDRTAFFFLGEIIETGSTKRIFTSPKKKLTDDYINGKIG